MKMLASISHLLCATTLTRATDVISSNLHDKAHRCCQQGIVQSAMQSHEDALVGAGRSVVTIVFVLSW